MKTLLLAALLVLLLGVGFVLYVVGHPVGSGPLAAWWARYAGAQLFLPVLAGAVLAIPRRTRRGSWIVGGMLALDVSLAADAGVDRVALVGAYLLYDTARAFAAGVADPPRVLVSHGRNDARVGFAHAETLVTMLETHGVPVTLPAHAGGHAFTLETARTVREFLAQ